MTITRLGEAALILSSLESSALPMLKEQVLNLTGVTVAIPAYGTLTVHYCVFTTCFEDLSRQALELTKVIASSNPQRHRIPVCYDLKYAPDLERLAQYCGKSIEEVISIHSSKEYTVAAIGFSPGFGFLEGLPQELSCPRLDSPRTSISPGSVGIAGMQTGVYPRQSAGGWNLIGRTTFSFVDYSLSLPSRLQVGDKVVFQPVPEL